MAKELNRDKYLGEAKIKELNNEGFPDYMIYAFLKTADETKTIISSRLPGGVRSFFVRGQT